MATKLTLAYDGTRFFGWAAQPGRRTVQGELEAALATLLRRPVALTVAGRTDRGVHALGQVASYDGPPPPLRSLNAILPADIGVHDAVEVPDGFSARHDAVARAYLYRLDRAPGGQSPFSRGRALWWPHRADLALLDACAEAVVGTHDFTAFTPTDTYHELFRRDISSAAWGTGCGLEFRIEGQTFMRSMVRVLVGTMLEVGSGRRSLDDFRALLEGAPRAAAGPTAPPHGLYLESVRYA